MCAARAPRNSSPSDSSPLNSSKCLLPCVRSFRYADAFGAGEQEEEEGAVVSPASAVRDSEETEDFDPTVLDSDHRIDWLDASESVDVARSVVKQLLDAPLSEVARIKVGYTSSPTWRMFGLPEITDNIVEPHYLDWSHMKVLVRGIGLGPATVERALLSEFWDNSKVQNIRGGLDGPVADGKGYAYVLWNRLDEVVGHGIGIKKAMKALRFCCKCASLVVLLHNYHGVFAETCACTYKTL